MNNVNLLPMLKPGSVVTVRVDGMAAEERRDFLYRLKGAIEKTKISPVTIIAMSGEADISVIDEETMRSHGWVRIGDA